MPRRKEPVFKDRVCWICNKLYPPTSAGQKFCCPDCKKEAARLWRLRYNTGEDSPGKKVGRAYYWRNHEKVLARSRAYEAANHDKRRARQNARRVERYATDPHYVTRQKRNNANTWGKYREEYRARNRARYAERKATDPQYFERKNAYRRAWRAERRAKGLKPT